VTPTLPVSEVPSEAHSSNKLLYLALGGIIVAGASTLIYSILQKRAEKRKAEKLLLSKMRHHARKQKAAQSSSSEASEAVNDSLSNEPTDPTFLKRKERIVRMYFDQNDEMVDE
jgi:hypothetical protein